MKSKFKNVIIANAEELIKLKPDKNYFWKLEIETSEELIQRANNLDDDIYNFIKE